VKKWFIVISASLLLLLSGCSLLDDAKNTITYINQATDYINTATEFANNAPAIAQQAVTDQQAAEQLETMLLDMKQEIETFNALQAPNVAQDLHQQLVEKNGIVLTGIDLYLDSIVDGKLDPAVIENTELFQTIQEFNSIIDQIKALGN
jgi:hypothetical protein